MLLLFLLLQSNVIGYRINSIILSPIRHEYDTIYGLCSSIPPGGCGIAVVRVSGPKAGLIFDKITKDSFKKVNTKKLLYKRLYSIDNEPIDDAICLLFQSPKSYTGEDVVEFHTHGSNAVINKLFDTISRIDDTGTIRLANRGEFTRRAFYNGKLDLSQAEAIGDLIAANTQEQLKLAYSAMSGPLHNLYKKWTNNLILALSNLEACIDFAEESSNDFNLTSKIKETKTIVFEVMNEIESKISDRRGNIIKNSANVIILGIPNSGKSTLINSITQENISIVSDIPGTTRDLVKACVDIDGFPFTFIDTAGIRFNDYQPLSSIDPIEVEGINRAMESALKADCIIQLLDPTNVEESLKALDRTLELIKDRDIPMILCHGKSDVIDYDFNRAKLKCPNAKFIKISPLLGSNIAELGRIIRDSFNFNDSESLISNHRHIEHLKSIKDILKYFLEIDLNKDIEIGTEYLRTSLKNMDAITGINIQESVLDKIFSNFCIGK